ATLYPYEQGFAPFSGYADWYQRAYRFTPTEGDLARASADYFRSSPIPPDPSYLAPDVAQAIFEPTPPPSVIVPGRTPAAAGGAARPRVERPSAPPLNASPGRATVYRGAPGELP